MESEVTRRMIQAMMIAALIATIVGRSLADDQPYLGSPVEEGSTSELGVVFRNTKGASVTPDRIDIHVDDQSSTQRLFGPVGVTPGPNVSYVLPPQANQIVDSSKAEEEHRITIEARYPSGCVPVPTPGSNCQYKVGEVRYLVKNRRVVVGQSTPGTFGPSPAPTGTPTP